MYMLSTTSTVLVLVASEAGITGHESTLQGSTHIKWHQVNNIPRQVLRHIRERVKTAERQIGTNRCKTCVIRIINYKWQRLAKCQTEAKWSKWKQNMDEYRMNIGWMRSTPVSTCQLCQLCQLSSKWRRLCRLNWWCSRRWRYKCLLSYDPRSQMWPRAASRNTDRHKSSPHLPKHQWCASRGFLKEKENERNMLRISVLKKPQHQEQKVSLISIMLCRFC